VKIRPNIIAALTERIPELETAQEPRKGHVTASEEGYKVRHPRSSKSPHSAALGGGHSSGWSEST